MQSFFGIKRFGWLSAILSVCILASVWSSAKSVAQTATQEQSKQQKAASSLRVVEEFINRHLYMQAQTNLAAAEKEYSAFMTAEQKAKVEQLNKDIQAAMAMRSQIAQVLRAADEQVQSGQYADAKKAYEGIQASPYLLDQEKQIIAAGLADVGKKLAEAAAAEAEALAQQAQPLAAEPNAVAAVQIAEVKQSEPNTVAAVQVVEAKQPEQEKIEPVAVQQPAVEEQPVAQQPVAVEVPAAPVAEPTAAAAPEAPSAEPTATAAQENSYLNEVKRRQSVQISYTKAVINDALVKADAAMAEKQYAKAREAMRTAYSTIERNRLLLGDAMYTAYKTQLTQKEETIAAQEGVYLAEQDKIKQEQANQITQELRSKMDTQRAQSVADYMERAYTFQKEQRYEEALGQIEQLLAVEPLNQQALALRQTLEDTVRWREQLRIRQESDQEEMKLLLEANRRSIPYANEINYPKNWLEISEKRDKMVQEQTSPVNAAVNKQLDSVVDLTALTNETTFAEAIQIMENSVTPAISIQPMWNDLSANAFIEQDTAINVSGQGLTNISLRKGLELVLQSVGASSLAEVWYVVDESIVKIATREALPATLSSVIYEIADLLNPPANYDEYNGGGLGGNNNGGGGNNGGGNNGGGGGRNNGGGGMGGGMSGGMGGGMGGGMMGGMGGGMMGGMGGGMMGGGMMGGMGGMGGGMGGGMSGMGMMSGMMNNPQAAFRGFELIMIIMETIEPDSWYMAGGEGRISQFSADKLIVWATPEIQEKVKVFLEELRKTLGQQIAIETRFLLVDESYLEDIGIDTEIKSLKVGGKWGTEGVIGPISQGSYDTTALPGVQNQALSTTIAYGDPLDDLQVEFMIRATQQYNNSKILTAPKAMVMNGESATVEVNSSQDVLTDSALNSDTVTTTGVDRTVYYFENTYDTYDKGVSLSVTPTISADKKYVILRVSTYLQDYQKGSPVEIPVGVDQNTGEPIYSNIFQPTDEMSSIQTRVHIPDRGTVLLGGMTITEDTQNEAGVPILNKLPIINRFFSNRSEAQRKRVLLILVKPTIVFKEEAEQEAVGLMTK